ncbi:MAG TPA: cytochrome C oxidase subunit IV family protein [Acidimicrobiales bacterium]|nr:cytochrome C oxidase subunit IV family protein [Acidimicrobiales bacterium]
MSTTEATDRDEQALEAHDVHDHPTDGKYIKIAILLAVLTAAEVATYPAEEALGSALVPILLVLMVIKFWYVAAFFMHLKFDSRMFSWVFVAGIVTAVAVYMVALATFEFFV